MCDFVMLLYKKHRFFIKNFNNKHKKIEYTCLFFFFFFTIACHFAKKDYSEY